jgi:hypothetical protein
MIAEYGEQPSYFQFLFGEHSVLQFGPALVRSIAVEFIAWCTFNWSFGDGGATRVTVHPQPVFGWRHRGQAEKNRFGSTWEFHMSWYSQTETAAAFAAHRTFSVRDVFSGVFGWVRVACNRRRQRQELIEYLANDHRAANDLGITTDVRNLFR